MRKIDGFKLSVLTVSIAAAAQANAALYQIEEVTDMPASTYARAVSEYANADLNCFDTTANCAVADTQVAGETLLGRMGEPYRDEVPYMGFFRNDIDESDDLRRYCYDFLGYSTCDSWGDSEWSAIARERAGWGSGYKANSTAINNGTVLDLSAMTGDADGSTVNSVVNTFASDGTIIGSTSAGFIENNNGAYPRQFRKRGFVYDGGTVTELKPLADINEVIDTHGQTSAFDTVDFGGQRLVGGSSASVVFGSNYSSDKTGAHSCTVGTDSEACNNLSFATQAVVWDQAGTAYPMVSGWIGGGSWLNDHRARQASLRGFEIVDTGNGDGAQPYGVGYSSQWINANGIAMAARAVVFVPKEGGVDIADLENPQWELRTIPGLELISDGTAVRLFTSAVDVNQSGLVIGHAKNEVAQSRIFPHKSFVYDVKANNTVLFESLNGMFSNVHTFASSINNHSEIVGWTDVEIVNEISGRQRRQRGFIYLHGDESRNLAKFNNNRGWLLDDLTYNSGDGAGTPSNQYRIAQAHDINDAGVISATALKCEGGYDSVASNATCSGTETLVAVKLMPNPEGEPASRPQESTNVERKGGSFGWLGLSLLALMGLRKRRQ
ncbi:DUF3466 family protein [Thaumasiovibrio subtropicus]|uniref:DUF3466 family protein n=1 Tax=Thaumasiovibrio subtropicus TaxID=1891207 RepID=UPI000B361483|nr:DUF3466 family protein [Thaumasiovibrio subtropicus]